MQRPSHAALEGWKHPAVQIRLEVTFEGAIKRKAATPVLDPNIQEGVATAVVEHLGYDSLTAKAPASLSIADALQVFVDRGCLLGSSASLAMDWQWRAAGRQRAEAPRARGGTSSRTRLPGGWASS